MKEYLSISEVSKMKGISVKSLRYYAQLGILTPAYINPDTGYRYYTTEQMFVLDLILTCIDLEIPLKHFHRYMQDDGTLNTQHMLEDGQKIAQEKLKKLTKTISEMQTMQTYLERSEQLARKKGVYQSDFPTRYFLCHPYQGDFWDLHYYMRVVTELYRKLKKQELQNRIRQGVLIYHTPQGLKILGVLEIEKPQKPSKDIVEIKQGRYDCEFFSDEIIEQGYEKYITNRQWKDGEGVLCLEIYGKQSSCTPEPVEISVIAADLWSVQETL